MPVSRAPAPGHTPIPGVLMCWSAASSRPGPLLLPRTRGLVTGPGSTLALEVQFPGEESAARRGSPPCSFLSGGLRNTRRLSWGQKGGAVRHGQRVSSLGRLCLSFFLVRTPTDLDCRASPAVSGQTCCFRRSVHGGSPASCRARAGCRAGGRLMLPGGPGGSGLSRGKGGGLQLSLR